MGWRVLKRCMNSVVCFEAYMKIPNLPLVSSLNNVPNQRVLAFFTDRFLRGYAEDDDWMTVYSGFLKNEFGNGYADSLHDLKLSGLIRFKWWMNSERMWVRYDPDNSVCTKYSLGGQALSKIYSNDFRFVPYRVKHTFCSPSKGRWKLKFGSSDTEKSRKIKENYRGITVEPEWIEYFQSKEFHPPNHRKYPNEPISQYGCYLHSKYLIESILKKEISVKTEMECGRAFHPIIELPSCLRKYIRKNGKKIIEIDAESFHPYLIAHFIEGGYERNRYLECLRRGIYEQFVDSDFSRDKVKASYQKFLSGKLTDSKSKEIQKWYELAFPDVILKMNELKRSGKTFQMTLQQLESSIFVDEVFMKAGFFSLPLHDGLAVLQEDVRNAVDFINAAFDKQLGYRIPLKID
jgi:hypothetical protein